MIDYAYADVNGIKIHYAYAGSGPLIMFLHGFPEYSGMWKKQLVEFGRDHLAVAPDMRGYNLSSRPQEVEQYKMRLLIEDIRQLAESLGHKKFTLVAHDWGGGVAWPFAAYFPQYLDGLIIINAPHPVTFQRELRLNPDQRKASSYILFFRDPKAEKVLSDNHFAWLLKGAFKDIIEKGVLKEEDIKGYIEAWSQPGALTGGLNYYRAADMSVLEKPIETPGGQAESQAFPKIKVPTLVIWGEKDEALLTGVINGLDQYVEWLTVKRIPDASHWVVHEKPDLVNSLIREFIQANSR